MAKFKMGVLINPYSSNLTARVADSAGASNQLRQADVGKLVKMVADSQYGLCAVGNEIEGFLATAEEMATQDGFVIGSVDTTSRIEVTLDGIQATPGTGTVVIGDYVVASTPVARNTASTLPPKVCKATAAGSGIVFKYRLVAITTGTGTVGSIGVIERVA